VKAVPQLNDVAGDWDVVVIGAGPAGTSAAIDLAQLGKSVLLVERKMMPRFKVCGCCLNQRSVDQLNQLGLLDRVWDANPVPLQRFHWVSRQNSVDIPLPGGIAMSRSTLDALLAERAAECGTIVLRETMATPTETSTSGRTVQLNHHSQTRNVTAKSVIVAAGLTGRGIDDDSVLVADDSLVGVGRIARDTLAGYEPGVIYMASGVAGYVGLTRIEDGRLNIAAALPARSLREGGPAAACETILRSAGLPEIRNVEAKHDSESRWSGTVSLTWRRSQPSAERTLYIGDAAGYVEPFTGEGITWALSAGRLAAAFLQGGDVAQARLDEWDALYEREIRKPQRLCRWMSRWLRHPILVRQTIGMINLCPWMARPIVRQIAGRSIA
jgi:menaquinone-9 beta-reductase